ncbi:MAG: sodium/proline symporter [Pseudomonadota bacterium]
MIDERVIVLITLVTYQVLLIGIGWWASKRTHDSEDFFLGGRNLGGFVAAISASASSSSAWTLLGVSGAAYAWGLSALWLFPATLSGFLINWVLIAPRLRTLAGESGAVTLTDVMAATARGERSLAVARLASIIVLVSFGFYVAAQFQAAGAAFDSQFGLDAELSVLIGALIVVLYTLLGGFWAVSVTDSVQGVLMAVTAVILPLAGVLAVGGLGPLWEHLASAGDGGPFGARAAPAAIGFVAGTLGIGLGYPGQPHVLNRFMALGDDQALRRARLIAVGWAVVVYAGMLCTGWCARMLLDPADAAGEQAFYGLTASLFPPVVAGMMLAAVLSAIMSTADSQLLVAASSVSHDLRRGIEQRISLSKSRAVVLGLSAFALALALYAPQSIFSRVLFAWHAVGSAFGPLVVAMLLGRVIPVPVRLAAMGAGAGLTVLAHWLADSPGDWLERLLPLGVSAVIVWAGSRPSRDQRGLASR